MLVGGNIAAATYMLRPRPVALVGFQLCGQLVGLGVIYSDGSRRELRPGEGADAVALIKKIPKERHHGFNVCPKVKEY